VQDTHERDQREAGDETVSASLYRRQADGGNAAAMANLGNMYEEGRGGLTKNDAEAEELRNPANQAHTTYR